MIMKVMMMNRVVPELDVPGHTGGLALCFPSISCDCVIENKGLNGLNLLMVDVFSNETLSIVVWIVRRS